MNKLELQKTANEVRKGIITAVHGAKAGHPGGSLSAADLFTYLYFEEMNVDPKDPKKADRDRFVLSKGHTAPGLYSTLANRAISRLRICPHCVISVPICRDIPVCRRHPALICRPALWDRVSPRR